MSVNGTSSGAITHTNYVNLSLSGSDSFSNITQFCFKYNFATDPLITDSCWVSVSANPPGLTPATSLSLVNYSFPIGMTSGVYQIYGWVRDIAGNISTLGGGGSGSAGQDIVSIQYQAPTPPTVTDVIGASNATPASPPNQTDLTVAASGTVYIQWNISSATGGLGSTPIALFSSTDNNTFVPITGAQALANGANGCTPDVRHSGCYKWTNGAPASGFFVARAVVTDLLGSTAAGTSAPVNSWPPISFLAGTTDSGTDGSASSAMFVSTLSTGSDAQSFVVTDGGVIYFRDIARGI